MRLISNKPTYLITSPPSPPPPPPHTHTHTYTVCVCVCVGGGGGGVMVVGLLLENVIVRIIGYHTYQPFMIDLLDS